MASGTILLENSAQTAGGGYLRGKLEWSSAADAAANASTVTAVLFCAKGGSTAETTGTWSYSLAIGGTAFSGTFYGAVGADWVQLASASAAVSHADDGTAACLLSGAAAAPAGTAYAGKTTAGSGTAALDAIPRASALSFAPAMTMGSAYPLTLRRAGADYVHDVVLTWPEGSETYFYLAEKTAADSLSWTPDAKTLGPAIPNAVSGRGTLTVHTWLGAVRVGSWSAPVTLTLPASAVPVVTAFSVTVQNSNAAFAGWGIAVRGASQAAWTASAAGSCGASIARCAFSAGSLSGTGASGVTAVLPVAGTVAPVLTVTDSRGRTAAKAAPALTVYDYAKPSLSAVSAVRCRADGTPDDAGTCVRAAAEAACSSLGGRNTVSLQYRARRTGGAWSGYAAVASGTVLTGYSAAASYEIELSAVDAAGSRTAAAVTIPTESVTFHVRDGGTGLGVGKIAEADNLMDCALPARFRGPVQADGCLTNDLTAVLNKNWLTVTFHRSASVKYARCSAAPNAGMTAGTSYAVGTLPAEFRPQQSVSAYLPVRYGSSPTFALLTVTTAGDVTFTPYDAITTAQGINFYLTFV